MALSEVLMFVFESTFDRLTLGIDDIFLLDKNIITYFSYNDIYVYKKLWIDNYFNIFQNGINVPSSSTIILFNSQLKPPSAAKF